MADEKEEIKVSEKEIEALNKEIEDHKQKELNASKKEIEEEVRKKVEQENKLKELEEQNKQLSESMATLQKQQEEKEKQMKEEFDTKINEIKATRQGIANITDPNKPTTNAPDLSNPIVLDTIEEESRKKFLEKHNNLPGDFGAKG